MKTIKIISTLVIAVLLVASLSQVCLATNFTDIINSVDTKSDSSTVSTESLQLKAGDILKVIRNIAAIVAVIIITILGIKYMMGSTQERAEYKKSFIPLIVGIVVVVAATTIATFIFNMAA